MYEMHLFCYFTEIESPEDTIRSSSTQQENHRSQETGTACYVLD